MLVDTESREKITYQEYKESRDKWWNAKYEIKSAEDAYKGAKAIYKTWDDEAKGKWGNDIPPGNTPEHRKKLEEDCEMKHNKLDDAKAKAKEPDIEFNGEDRINPNTGEKYHVPGVKEKYEKMKNEEEENDMSY